MDVRNKDQVVSRMRAAVASKQFGQEDILCSLVADVIITRIPCLVFNILVKMFLMYISYLVTQACIQVCPKNPANFNVDNVRVAKLLGGGLHNCTIVRGMVLKSDAVGSIKRMEKAKVTATIMNK